MLERLVTALGASVRARLGRYGGGDHAQDDGGSPTEPPAEPGGSARMFVCRACNTSYITTEMDACSTCGNAVEPEPDDDYTRDGFV